MGRAAILIAALALLGFPAPRSAPRDHPVHVVMDVFEVPAAAEATDATVVRERWPVRFGIPVSRHSRVEDASKIVVQGSDLAQYRVTARWPEGFVRWLQIDARVDFDPARSSRMLLVTAGDPITAEGQLARGGGEEPVAVDTKTAGFSVADALDAGGGVTLRFEAHARGEIMPAAFEQASIEENGGLRSDVASSGRAADGSRFRTLYSFFRDRGLVRVDHVVELPRSAAGPITVDRVVARLEGTQGMSVSEGRGWITRSDGRRRLTIVAPTRRPGAHAPTMVGEAVIWECGRLDPGQCRGFELWLDVADADADAERIAHQVMNPLMARAVDAAQYSSTATMPDPVLAPVVARFYHARNQLDWKADAGPTRTPPDVLKEATYDALRAIDRPAKHFARSLGLLEEALWAAPDVPVASSLRGLLLHARLFGDHRAADAVAHRAGLVEPSDLALRVDVGRFTPVEGGEPAWKGVSGRAETSAINETVRGLVRWIDFRGPAESCEDAADELADLIVRGAWTAGGFATRIEVRGGAVEAFDPSPTTVDVGAALVRAYVSGGGRPVLERARAHLDMCARETGSVVPVLGDSLRHDVLYLLMNLPIIPTWRELPLDAVEARDGAHLLSWTVPEGADRIRIKYADRRIVTPTLDDPLPLPGDVVPFWRAANVTGEPAPAEPGTTQSIRILGANPGAVFAARYLDVPQRIRRDFERGPATGEISLAGLAPAVPAESHPAPSPSSTPITAIVGGALALVLAAFVLARRRTSA